MDSKESTGKAEIKNTVELDLARKAKNNTVSMQKPTCKDGVCSITWKPIKPAA